MKVKKKLLKYLVLINCITIKNQTISRKEITQSIIMQNIEFINLRAFTTKTTGQLDILWLNSNTFGVNGRKICVFKKTH